MMPHDSESIRRQTLAKVCLGKAVEDLRALGCSSLDMLVLFGWAVTEIARAEEMARGEKPE